MENKKVYRKAIIKKGKPHLKKDQEVLVEEVCIGRGKYMYYAYKPEDMSMAIPIAPSEFEYTEKEKYIVLVTRISTCTKQFEVEAKNRKEAENIASEEAVNVEFSEDDAEYKVDCVFTKKQWEDMRS